MFAHTFFAKLEGKIYHLDPDLHSYSDNGSANELFYMVLNSLIVCGIVRYKSSSIFLIRSYDSAFYNFC